jgi:DNA-directed RNA polymerase specialized sigma24 family protein
MISKRKNNRAVRGRHPCEHLDGSLKVLASGHTNPQEQRTKAYFDSWKEVNTTFCALGTKILGGRNVRNPGLAAEEVTLKWFITMRNGGFANCDPNLPFFPFAYVIFLGQCMNYGRAERRRQIPALIESTFADEYVPACPMEVGEVDSMVHRALDRLPVHLRDAVMSQYFEELSAAEAAVKYRTTPANMDLRRCRGRKMLAVLLKELDPRC